MNGIADAGITQAVLNSERLESPQHDTGIMRPSLGSSHAVDAYCSELRCWLDGKALDDAALYDASVALCSIAKAGGLLPEHILIMFHSAHPRHRRFDPDDYVQGRKYVRAVRLLMTAYFRDGTP